MTFIYAKELSEEEQPEETGRGGGRDHRDCFSHSIRTRSSNYTTFLIADGMFLQCLTLTVLCLNHAHGIHYYYPDQGIEHQENDQAYYEFKYGVHDQNTGDIKNQWEIRKGDKVRGEYSLLEPDGTIRTVQYSADKRHGFNAVVKREGKSQHPTTKQKNHSFIQSSKEHNTLINYIPEYLEEEPKFIPKHQTTFYSPEEYSYEVSESKRKSFHELPDVPPNHSPTYTGVSDYNKLVNMYKAFREKNSNTKKHKFDYGINEYFENGYEALSQRNNYKNRILSPNQYFHTRLI